MAALQYSEYYLVTTIYLGPTGVTRQNIKMQKTSEIQPISEVFRYPLPAFRRKILKQRGGRKGYPADRGVDGTLARVATNIGKTVDASDDCRVATRRAKQPQLAPRLHT